jgi:arginine/lysine/ornithine decarboxylase
VPVLAPGERITADVVDYLTSGPPAGMLIPDATDPTMKTIRVVAR